MQWVSKIILDTFYLNKHLSISSYRTLPGAILANIFLVYHILLLFHFPKGSWNKLQNIRKKPKDSNSEESIDFRVKTEW